jgi:hypothetical protein
VAVETINRLKEPGKRKDGSLNNFSINFIKKKYQGIDQFVAKSPTKSRDLQNSFRNSLSYFPETSKMPQSILSPNCKDHVTKNDMSQTTHCFNSTGPFKNDVISKSIEIAENKTHKSSIIDYSLHSGVNCDGSRPESNYSLNKTSVEILKEYKVMTTDGNSTNEVSNFPSVKGVG